MKRDQIIFWALVGIGTLIVLGTGGVIAVSAWKQSANAQKWAQFLADAEDYYGIPRDLLARIAYQESHYRDDIIDGTTTSTVGALGIMQLIPQFFPSVRVPIPFTDDDTKNQINEAGTLLKSLHDRFNDWGLAVAAYNDGAGNIHAYLAGERSLPKQTSDYVKQVLGDVPVAGAFIPA